MAEILVVDDEIGIRELLSEILGDEGHAVLTAENAREARRLRDENPLDLVLLDIWMPDTDGVSLLKEWATSGKLTMPVIMMSGHATIDTAVEATRIGALDFLEKPITMQKLLDAVETGLQRRRGFGRTASQAVPVAATAVGYAPVQSLGQGPGAPAAVLPASAGLASATTTEVSGSLTGLFGPEYERSGSAAEAGAQQPGTEQAVWSALREIPLDAPLREARDAFERAYFEHHLAREQGSMTRVAERSGLERTHLYRKLKQLGIDLSRGVWRKPGGG